MLRWRPGKERRPGKEERTVVCLRLGSFSFFSSFFSWTSNSGTELRSREPQQSYHNRVGLCTSRSNAADRRRPTTHGRSRAVQQLALAEERFSPPPTIIGLVLLFVDKNFNHGSCVPQREVPFIKFLVSAGPQTNASPLQLDLSRFAHAREINQPPAKPRTYLLYVLEVTSINCLTHHTTRQTVRGWFVQKNTTKLRSEHKPRGMFHFSRMDGLVESQQFPGKLRHSLHSSQHVHCSCAVS